MTSPVTLSISNLTVTTQKHGKTCNLVDGLSLDILSGRVLALVGASGSGKSLSCAACLDVLPAGVNRQSGQVMLDGIRIDFAALRGRIVSSIMQNPRSRIDEQCFNSNIKLTFKERGGRCPGKLNRASAVQSNQNQQTALV